MSEVWQACVTKSHSLCPGRVLYQEPWATAGDPPPTPDAPKIRWIGCACVCHTTPIPELPPLKQYARDTRLTEPHRPLYRDDELCRKCRQPRNVCCC